MERGFEDLVHGAIDRKYYDHSVSDVRRVVSEAARAFRQAHSERALLRCRMPGTDFHSDVVNQVRCLYAIEVYWRFRPPGRGFVRKVHAVACGVRLGDVKIRTNNVVADYSGPVLGKARDITRGLAAITKKLAEVDHLSGASAADKGLFLAELFAAIIRVHPFQDGNGRTARMLIQYCLRYWRDDYVIVPKVRNNKRWKRALDEAVRGQLSRLRGFFARRIRPRIG